MITRTQHYNHHPKYVAKVQDELINYLNRAFNLNLSIPIINRKILRKKERISQDEGIRLSATLREKHDNNLTLEIDTSMHCTWCPDARIRRTRNLTELFPSFNFFPNS